MTGRKRYKKWRLTSILWWSTVFLLMFAVENIFLRQFFLAPFQKFNEDENDLLNVDLDEFPNFTITICPHVTPSMSIWRNFSSIQQQILRTVMRSNSYQPLCDPLATFAVMSHDAISRDHLDASFKESLIEDMKSLSPKPALVVFNFFAGTWPDYTDRPDFDLTNVASLAKASLAKSDRRPMDISLPLFPSEHPFRGRHLQIQRKHADKYLVTFKGKRYLSGAGLWPRNRLYEINDYERIVLLTTCIHGKNWQRQADSRCSEDNRQYEKFDYLDLIANSTFCLVPRGRRLATYRFLEVLKYGCIPVVFNDSWVLPFDQIIDWKKIVVTVDGSDFHRLPQILADFSPIDISRYRILGRYIYESYFSSIEQIIQTTLEILNQISLLEHQRKPYHVLNRRPGALVVDWPKYSTRYSDYPFYMSKNRLIKMSAVIRVNRKHCGSRSVGTSVENVVKTMKTSIHIPPESITVDNRCRLFGNSDQKNVQLDAASYLKYSTLNRSAVLIVDPIWLFGKIEQSKTILDEMVNLHLKYPEKLVAYDVVKFRLSGALLKESTSKNSPISNCSGEFALPDFNKAFILHRYMLHWYNSQITKQVKNQAMKIAHCEYFLLLSQISFITNGNGRSFVTVIDTMETSDDVRVIPCSCVKVWNLKLVFSSHNVFFLLSACQRFIWI